MKQQQTKAAKPSWPEKTANGLNKESGTNAKESGSADVSHDLSERGSGDREDQRDASARGAGGSVEHDHPSKRGAGGWDGFAR